MTREEKKEELIGLFSIGAIFIGDLIDECFEFADANPHWISVKDELPLPNESVIVYRKHGQMCDARFSKYGYWVDYSGYMMTQNVTHWMPLPASPSGSSEKPNNCKKFDMKGYENVIIHEGNAKGYILKGGEQ